MRVFLRGLACCFQRFTDAESRCRAIHGLPGLLADVKRASQPLDAELSDAAVCFLEALPSLQSLCLRRPHTLFGVHRLQRLTSISLTTLPAQTLDLAPLAAVTSLCQLTIQVAEGRALCNLGSLAALQLTQLQLLGRHDQHLFQLPSGLSKLTTLQSLNLDLCCAASEDQLQADVHSLQALTCLHLPAEGWELCPALTALQRLDLCAHDGVAYLTALTVLRQLSFLMLSCATEFQHVADLAYVRGLQSLSSLYLLDWQVVQGLQRPGLTALGLFQLRSGEHCVDLQDVPQVSHLDLDAVEEGVMVTLTPSLGPLAISVGGDPAHLTLALSAQDILSGRVAVTAAPLRGWTC